MLYEILYAQLFNYYRYYVLAKTAYLTEITVFLNRYHKHSQHVTISAVKIINSF